MLISAFCICLPAHATDKESDIETNRPSFTFSSIVVPKGSIQVENGSQYVSLDPRKGILDLPETQIRVGLLKRTEFQMFVPSYLFFHRPGQTNDGVTDLQEVGIKQQLPCIKGLQTSFIGSLNLPTGRRFISGPGVQPVFRLPASIPIGKTNQLCAMPTFALFDSGASPAYQQTVMYNHSFGKKAIVFIEYAGFFKLGTPVINFAHLGGEYKITPRNQIDLHFGVGLNRDAPNLFVGAGYSFRIDKFCPSSK
ncbi:MAG: transporter [Candidatus Obscuribacterales bacterium]|nr:transporter [Candidatus Obscuribacterales bacterium]